MLNDLRCKHGLVRAWCSVCTEWRDFAQVNRRRTVHMPSSLSGSQTNDRCHAGDMAILDLISRRFKSDWFQSWLLVTEALAAGYQLSTATSSLVRLHRNGYVEVDRKYRPWRYRFAGITL